MGYKEKVIRKIHQLLVNRTFPPWLLEKIGFGFFNY